MSNNPLRRDYEAASEQTRSPRWAAILWAGITACVLGLILIDGGNAPVFSALLASFGGLAVLAGLIGAAVSRD